MFNIILCNFTTSSRRRRLLLSSKFTSARRPTECFVAVPHDLCCDKLRIFLTRSQASSWQQNRSFKPKKYVFLTLTKWFVPKSNRNFAEMYTANICHGDSLVYFHGITVDSDAACVTLLLQSLFFSSHFNF